MASKQFAVVVWRDTKATGGYYSPKDVVKWYASRPAAEKFAEKAPRRDGLVVRSASYIR